MVRRAVGGAVAIAAMASAPGWAAEAPSVLALPAFHKGALVTVQWTALGPEDWTAGSTARGYVVEAFEGASAAGAPVASATAGAFAQSATLPLKDGRAYLVQVRSVERVRGSLRRSADAGETATVVDATPPVGAVTINGGAPATNSLTVTLGLSPVDPAPAGGAASGVTRAQLSQSGPSFPCATVALACPNPFLAQQPFTFTDGPDGPRSVWAAFQDGARSGVSLDGNTSEPVRATILVDRRPPTPVVATSGPGVAGTPLTLSAAESVDSGGEAASGVDPSRTRWEFGDGGTDQGASTSHVYVQAGTVSGRVTVADRAGNTSSATFTVTVTAPTGGATTPPSTGGTTGTPAPTPTPVPSAGLFRGASWVGPTRAGRRLNLRVTLAANARVQVKVLRPRAGRGPRVFHIVRVHRGFRKGVTVVRMNPLPRGRYVVRLIAGARHRDVPLTVR